MEIRQQLAAALSERLRIVADEKSRAEPEQHIERLRAVSEKIATLQRELPASADPQLAHFLQRGSYVKALDYLESGDR